MKDTVSDGKRMSRYELIDRAEVFIHYNELVRKAKANGYAGYLSKQYYYDAISRRMGCTPRTIRGIFNKRDSEIRERRKQNYGDINL